MTRVFKTILIQLMIAMFYNPIWSQSTIGLMLTICNASKFDYLSFAGKNNFLSSNVYVKPDLSIINQHDNVKYLGILMSSDCTVLRKISYLLVVGALVWQGGY